MRYIGLDYGTKKVGVALSDEAGTMGFPHSVVPNGPGLMETVRALAAKEEAGAAVIGDSRDFSGNENPVAVAAKEFGARFHEESGLPVFYETELLTTQEARRAMDGTHPQHVPDRQRRSAKAPEGPADASAAALILTSYLSRGHD